MEDNINIVKGAQNKYFKAPHVILFTDKLKIYEKLVLLAMLSVENRSGASQFYFVQEDLMKEIDVGKTSFQQALSNLRAKGFIHIYKQEKTRVRKYEINWDYINQLNDQFQASLRKDRRSELIELKPKVNKSQQQESKSIPPSKLSQDDDIFNACMLSDDDEPDPYREPETWEYFYKCMKEREKNEHNQF